MFYARLEQILNDLTACLPGVADNRKIQKLVSFCGETPTCDSYLMVSSNAIRFVDQPGGGGGTLNQCASVLEIPVTVTLAAVCIPQPNDRGLPTDASLTKARISAYQQMENLAGCLSTLPMTGCEYSLRPEVSCEVIGTSYAAVAEFSLTLKCLELAPLEVGCC